MFMVIVGRYVVVVRYVVWSWALYLLVPVIVVTVTWWTLIVADGLSVCCAGTGDLGG
jgi:hypothetical protein